MPHQIANGHKIKTATLNQIELSVMTTPPPHNWKLIMAIALAK